jgi:hypothetical protein
MKETIVYTATAIFALAALGFVIAGLAWALREQEEPPKQLFPKEYSAADEASLVAEQYLQRIGATL